MARRLQRVTVSGTWARRDARAQQLGYRNYYDYRAHSYGQVPASEPAATGARLRRLRGHASAADLVRDARVGDLISVYPGERDSRDGRYRRVEVLLVDADGEQTTYTLTGRLLRAARLDQLVEDLDAIGVVFSPSPSLDLRRLRSEQRDAEKKAA